MKNILLLLASVFAIFALSGCNKNPDTPKKKCQYTSDMTSKQVEAKMKWKYCEESK